MVYISDVEIAIKIVWTSGFLAEILSRALSKCCLAKSEILQVSQSNKSKVECISFPVANNYLYLMTPKIDFCSPFPKAGTSSNNLAISKLRFVELASIKHTSYGNAISINLARDVLTKPNLQFTTQDITD